MSLSSDIERKILALHSIESIVEAMKAYAGVTLRRTEERVPPVRAYENAVLRVLAELSVRYPDIPLARRDRGRRIILALGSSQGLCGAFNEKAAEEVSKTMKDDDALFVVGRRLRSALAMRGIESPLFRDAVLSINGIQAALQDAVSEVMQLYEHMHYDSLTLIFTTVVKQSPRITVESVLPPEIGEMSGKSLFREPPLTYLDVVTILQKVIEEFLYITLYRCYLESLQSENWYRLRSMEGASDSLKRKISGLISVQRYARQEEITEEMLEILGSGMFYGMGP